MSICSKLLQEAKKEFFEVEAFKLNKNTPVIFRMPFDRSKAIEAKKDLGKDFVEEYDLGDYALLVNGLPISSGIVDLFVDAEYLKLNELLKKFYDYLG